MDTIERSEYVVGGVRMPRPFQIRRLGHFGISVIDVAACKTFYTDLLGFAVSDTINFNRIFNLDDKVVGPGDGYFLRHGTDHHSFVLFPIKPMQANPAVLADMGDNTINQVTWQVGSLKEVVDAIKWFGDLGIRIERQGRDTPGSNWHCYPRGLDGHVNELFYGIEQVGWNGRSKPGALHSIRYMEPPQLPHVSEFAEVEEVRARGVDVESGYRWVEKGEAKFDVSGVLLPRPFKISRIGPIRLFVKDLDKAIDFYRDMLGLKVTEEIQWNSHRCAFLRANTEHHSLALYPIALRRELGLSEHTSLMACGMQVGDYAQLRNAEAFLKDHGVTIRRLPAELFPGIDYSALAIDPSGHAVHLYYYMEQIGWDGKPRPAAMRPKIDNDNWPVTVAAAPDTFMGESFMGPWG
ncbi:MAG: VOC family protein [Burkholderiales bacterium]